MNAKTRTIAAAITAMMMLAACSGQPSSDDAVGSPTPSTSTLVKGDRPTKGAGKGKATPSTGPTASSPATDTGDPPTPTTPVTVTKDDKGFPEAHLYTGAANTQGITGDQIVLCEHAGITLASAFGNDPAKFDAYWRMVNDAGGVDGRKVALKLKDDGYNANQAATAFDQCDSENPFFTIGGIGFDQIPAVREKAEQAKEFYIYGTATSAGTADDKYSFSVGPTVEYMGARFAEATEHYNHGKKVGILTVSSPGWKPGADAFTKRAKQLGMELGPTREISSNNDVLTSHVSALEDAGVQVVFLNVNALAFTRFVLEADSQNYYPRIIGWSFNLETEKVGDVMRKFPLSQGLSAAPVYDPGLSYPWSAEYDRMLAAYKKYYNDSSPNDIDWIQWIAMKGFHRMLLDCGKGCTRNRLGGMLLSGYEEREAPNCTVDFSRGGGRFGGWLSNYWQAIDRGSSQVWKQIQTCKDRF